MRSVIILALVALLAVVLRSLCAVPPAPIFFLGIACFVWYPQLLASIRHRAFQSVCEEWLRENGFVYKYVEPELKYFSWGKLFRRVSDVQLVFCSNNGKEEEFWFECGGWWCGVINKKVKVYKNDNGELIYVDSKKA